MLKLVRKKVRLEKRKICKRREIKVYGRRNQENERKEEKKKRKKEREKEIERLKKKALK